MSVFRRTEEAMYGGNYQAAKGEDCGEVKETIQKKDE